MYQYLGLNEALRGLLRELMSNGQRRETRGSVCYEFPYPVVVEILEPTARNVTIPARKWNYVLPYSESLWIGLGYNVLADGPGRYVKRLYDYSDNGVTWRAGYGPRIRAYDNLRYQYYQGSSTGYGPPIPSGLAIDQLEYVVRLLRMSPDSRQAVISIADPIKDQFDPQWNIRATKDVPCTRSLHFMADTDGRLNLYVHMRSNDLIFGFSAVNVPNFTLMQEYVAALVGMPLGRYYHIADNLHVYDHQLDMSSKIIESEEVSYSLPYEYRKDDYKEVGDFTDSLRHLKSEEDRFYRGDFSSLQNPARDELFEDWRRVLALKNMERAGKVDSELLGDFYHPQLQEIANRRKKKYQNE